MWSSCRPSVLPSRQAGVLGAWEPVEFPAMEGDGFVPLDEVAELASEHDALVEAMAAAAAREEEAAAAEREAMLAEAYAAGVREGRGVGREAGYAEGFEAGRLEGERAEGLRLANALLAAEHALEDVRSGEEKWVGAIEENLCALAVAIARQVVGRELGQGPEVVAELVRRALAEFPIDQPIRVRVNPTDLVALSPLSASLVGAREAAWVADAQIAPGGCLVEGRDRIVDGRVDSALERVYRRLTHKHA